MSYTLLYQYSAVVILMPSIATKMTNTNDWLDVMATPLLSLLLMPAGLSLGPRLIVVLLLVVLLVLLVLVVLVVLVGLVITSPKNNII